LPRINLFLLLLVISKCFLPAGNAQTSISGIINDYVNVVSVDGNDSITVSDASAFAVGDTVLLIQVKGIGINVNDEPAQFGLSQDDYGAGKYEFLIINTINQGTGEVSFTGDMGNFTDYDAGGSLQLVRVPGYDNASVTGTLTCESWDSTTGTGGVVAMIIGNTLMLDADIDVTGKGFKGGKASSGTEECSSDNPSRYDHLFFHEDSLTAGYKGEGAASYAFNNTAPLGMAYKKGRGPLFNGGGGGNGKYSGGGGGANYGPGGNGGSESKLCGDNYIGGKAGWAITNLPFFVTEKRIFMGGGGGSGTQQNPGDGTDGGNGGGIIIIIADTLIGNGNTIKANGADVTGITNENGGAGGGGAGGTILLEVNNFKGSNLTVEMKGGKGGDSGAGSGSCTGPGGGGGGGVVWHSSIAVPPEVSIDVSGGAMGWSNCGLIGMTDGDLGDTISGLKVPLTGFLFNSIFSFNTGADHDTICESDTPPKMLGTAPKGGTPDYEYQWRSSTDNINWDSIEVDWTTSQRDYYPVYQLFDTIYYRRYVRDQSVPTPIVDISKVLTLIVQPKIQQNSFSFDTTICNGQVPNPIIPVFPSPIGGDGIYTYYWEKSTNGINFNPADGVNNTAIYSPPALTDTTYFRRTVYSGKCQHTSDTVTITVLPLIADNSITDNQIICEGSIFNQLDGSVPTGGEGAGTYTYKWIESTDASTWGNAFGPDNNEDYLPDTTSTDFPGTVYFSRVVYSGPADCCIDTSNQVILTDWPKLESNSITADQTICEADVPAPFNGSDPAGGDGTYTFLWEQSEDNLAYISGIETNNSRDYTPGALIDTTYYRRVVTSSVCADTSGFIKITVEPALANFGIQTLSGASDTTICSGQIPNSITYEFVSPVGGNGIYSYLWEKSLDGINFNDADGVNDIAVYSPPALTNTTYFRRKVYSGQCQEVSDTITVNVLPLISNNTLPANTSICSGTNISLTGSTPAGGAGSGSYIYFWEESTDNLSWSPASGINSQKDYTTPDLISPMYYRRTVISGLSDCCQDVSTSVLIDIYPLPSASIDALDTTVCSGSPVDLTFRVVGVNGPWDLTYTDGTTPVTVTIPNGTAFIETITRLTDLESVSYIYTIESLIDAKGCIAPLTDLTGQAKVTLNGIPVADAGPDDEVCSLTYTLQAVPGSFGTGVWTLPPAIAADIDADDPNKVVIAGGNDTITYTWTVTNGVCPPESDSVTIIYWEPPSVGDAGQDQNLDPYITETELKASFSGPLVGNILWTTTGGATIQSPNDSVTKVVNLDLLENIFTLTVSNGICPENVDNVKVFVQGEFFVPSGISPTITPGQNDFFRVKGVENVENELIIFSRWGQVILNVKNFMHQGILSQGWDGTDKSGNQLHDDTYYYILKIKGPYPQTLSGFIVIKGVSK
jgi:gliding motility-associated-like protein